MWNTFQSQGAAESFLAKEGFTLAADGSSWERGERFLTYCRVSVGKCKDGKFTISRESNL